MAFPPFFNIKQLKDCEFSPLLSATLIIEHFYITEGVTDWLQILNSFGKGMKMLEDD
jgi:hypothetical protein